MAAKTPVTRGNSRYFYPDRVQPQLVSAGQHDWDDNPGSGNPVPTANLKVHIAHFADVDTSDHWDTGLKSIVAAFWHGDDSDDDKGTALVDPANRATGRVLMLMQNANSSGTVLVLHRGY